MDIIILKKRCRDCNTFSLYRAESNNASSRVIMETVLDLYQKQELDEIYVIYTQMESAVKEEAEMLRFFRSRRQILAARKFRREF